MQKLSSLFFILIFIFSVEAVAQKPVKPSSAEIYHKLQKLNFVGSVLYIAAHPDDENTRAISYFSNHIHARTGYLSLTRGDGGQNLIGTELRELLGVIRTQELIEARKIDGGEQFFTRANDFGYSKIPDETLRKWDKSQVLNDMVLTIRKFRPDIIINRFDSRTPGKTHGHHTASAMLSLESFELAADTDAFPDQLLTLQPWKPKRAFFNTSWWFYGGRDKFEKADKSKHHTIDIGVFYSMLGKSNQEIAALSRSRHQSQGFGTTGSRGGEAEFLELVKGDAPIDKANLFEGIDTTWNRIPGGKPIGDIIARIIDNYDFTNPSASLGELVKAYALVQNLKDDHWKSVKSLELKDIIIACAGLYLEAVAEFPDATPGSSINVNFEAINRSATDIRLASVETFPGGQIVNKNLELKNNIGESFQLEINLPSNIHYTTPYWLRSPADGGMYRVDDVSLIGAPDIVREVRTVFNLIVAGITIPVERDIIYKYNDDVKGEVYEPFDIIPDAALSFADKVTIFTPRKRSKNIIVRVRSGKEMLDGSLRLDLPDGWKSTPRSVPLKIDRKGSEQSFEFEVTAPQTASEITVKAIATIGNKEFAMERIDILYGHISKQMVLMPAEAKFLKPDLKTGNEKIAYIMGAGDEVNKSIEQMGYAVSLLEAKDITPEKLSEFDVVITGIRAYNTNRELGLRQNLLLDFVRSGKTMIVQYNTLDDLVTKDMAPFPMKISRDRVTEEDAEVRFLAPGHRVMNYPNKITPTDFTGWKQELGLYFPDQWDPAFIPILSANDSNESPKNGALLVAKYGKGHYIYTGLSFFRELPEGVTGAFRLMANLISIGN